MIYRLLIISISDRIKSSVFWVDMYNLQDVDIRFIDGQDWEDAMSLAYRTFLKFDAKMFTDEGIRHFREFISDNFLKRMFEAGEYQVVGAYYHGKMIGVISLRNNCHISLLFVDEEFHKMGIGRKLIMAIGDYTKLKLHQDCLTVNAAPYATDFYHRVGFEDIGPITSQDGITFTPMRFLL